MALRLSSSALGAPLPKSEILTDFKAKIEKEPFDELVLDLTGIEKLFSWAIRVVVGLHKECAARGKPFSVETDNDSIVHLFKMLKLDSLFTVKAVGK